MNGTLSKASVIMQAHNQAKFNFNEPSLGKGLTISQGLERLVPYQVHLKTIEIIK